MRTEKRIFYVQLFALVVSFAAMLIIVQTALAGEPEGYEQGLEYSDVPILLSQAAAVRLPAFAFVPVAHADPSPLPSPGLQVVAIVQSTSLGASLTKAWDWLSGPAGFALLGLLFAISEALGSWFPNLKANGVFQLFRYGLTKIDPNLPATKLPPS